MQFTEGVTADLTPEGTLEYNFPEPRPVSEIIVQTKKDDQPLEVVFILEDGTETSPSDLDTSSDEPVKNDIPDQPGVVKVIIKTPDDTPLIPEDIISLEVIACKEGNKSFILLNCNISKLYQASRIGRCIILFNASLLQVQRQLW